MGDLSKNFSRKEFTCRCKECGQDTIDYETIIVLEDIREHFGQPVKITSANRCLKYNRRIGSSDKSQHPKSRAVDITVKGFHPDVVHNYLIRKYKNRYGIGKYDNFTHIDTRGYEARW